MWTKAQTLEDAVKYVTINATADPDSYNFLNTKGMIEYQANRIYPKFQSQRHQYWFYEDGDKKAAIGMDKDEQNVGRVLNFTAHGFSADLYENCKTAFPIMIDHLRTFTGLWNVNQYSAKSPRTKMGECFAYLAQAYLWEATSQLSNDGATWITSVDRDPRQKPADEAEYKLVRTPTIDADVASGKPLEPLKEAKADVQKP